MHFRTGTSSITVTHLLTVPTHGASSALVTTFSFALYFDVDITMAMAVGTNTADAPSCAPTQFVFDAVDQLSNLYLTAKWTGSIKFRSLPVPKIMIGSPLDKTCVAEVDICDYLGPALQPTIHRLYLDPQKYCNKPPLNGEPVANNPHWKQLKDALEAAAHTSGSPIMSNGGNSDYRVFKCKLRNRLHKPKLLAKKDGAPREDDCINMDKGGRRHNGRAQSKRTRSYQALASNGICPFHFTFRWDFFGFCIST
jgi:hypothetical protein